MNILLACFAKMVDDSGGLAKVTCAFAKEMYERGHRVTLVYSDDKEGKFFLMFLRRCSVIICIIIRDSTFCFR